MNINIHKNDVTKIERYEHGKLVMLTLHIDHTQVCLFMPTAQADILFPALQKVYENAENAPKI